MKTETFNGCDVRFIDIRGEWWAVLSDLCVALDPYMREEYMENRVDSQFLRKEIIDGKAETVVNELGIYDILLSANTIDARKFRVWTTTVLQRLRKYVGLDGYGILRMTEEDIQDQIDDILDTLFYNEETGQLMMSVTIAGGDVEPVPFDI